MKTFDFRKYQIHESLCCLFYFLGVLVFCYALRRRTDINIFMLAIPMACAFIALLLLCIRIYWKYKLAESAIYVIAACWSIANLYLVTKFDVPLVIPCIVITQILNLMVWKCWLVKSEGCVVASRKVCFFVLSCLPGAVVFEVFYWFFCRGRIHKTKILFDSLHTTALPPTSQAELVEHSNMANGLISVLSIIPVALLIRFSHPAPHSLAVVFCVNAFVLNLVFTFIFEALEKVNLYESK